MHNFIYLASFFILCIRYHQKVYFGLCSSRISEQHRSEEASVGGLHLAYVFILILIICLPLFQVYVSSLVHLT